MRSFGRLWVMVMCVIIAFFACTDDKQIEKVRKAKKELEQIEEQKRQEEEKKKEEERKKREEKEKKQEEERKKKEEEERKKREEEEKKQEEERKKKEEEERKKREEEEQKKKEEEERKKKEEEERKKREEEEKKKKEEEERKKKEEEEKKKKEEEAKFKVLEGVYSGKRTYTRNQYQIDEVFNVAIGYSKEDKKWNVTFSSVKIEKTAALITQEEDKLIFYVEWHAYDDFSATLLFTPSSKKLKITTTCSDSSENWTYEGTKQ